MEIRKIQNTASGSFFITLPKDWVQDTKVIKGEEIIVSRNEDGSLRLAPLRTQNKYYNEFILDAEEYPDDNSLERCINSCYIQGSDVIMVQSEHTISMEKKDLIKRCTYGLIGTEISDEFSNKITIRVLVDPVKFPLADLIKRIYTLVSSMHLDAMRSFQEKDVILANDVIIREKEVDKLYFLMLRQLNLSLDNKLNLDDLCTSAMKIDCVLGIILARDLSKMAHYAVEIAEQVVKLKDKEILPKIKDHLINMSRFIIRMQQNAILSFFKNDFLRANKILNKIHKVVEFDMETKNAVLVNEIEDINVIISLITVSRNLRNIASCAVAVAQDLQAKYRPKIIHKKEMNIEDILEPVDLL